MRETGIPGRRSLTNNNRSIIITKDARVQFYENPTSPAMLKRMLFSFDERTPEILEKLKKGGHFRSFAEVVRESLRITATIHDFSERGFSEIVVRNPHNSEERVLVFPSLLSPR